MPTARQVSSNEQVVYVVDGSRTPFLKARSGPGPFRPSDIAEVVRRLGDFAEAYGERFEAHAGWSGIALAISRDVPLAAATQG